MKRKSVVVTDLGCNTTTYWCGQTTHPGGQNYTHTLLKICKKIERIEISETIYLGVVKTSYEKIL